MLVAAAGIYGVSSSSAFDLTDIAVTGATFTEPGRRDRHDRGREGPEPVHAADRRRSRPRCATCRRSSRRKVTIALPHTLDVAIKEREAVMVWKVGARRYLAGADGELFARLTEDDPDGRRGTAGRRGSPRVVRRAVRRAAPRYRSISMPRPGSPRSCRPTSAAAPRSLVVWVTDENGFIVRARPGELGGRLRLLHGQPADDRADPGPGPPAAQPAVRPRGHARLGHPRVGHRRHVHRQADADPEAEARARDQRASGCRASLPRGYPCRNLLERG